MNPSQLSGKSVIVPAEVVEAVRLLQETSKVMDSLIKTWRPVFEDDATPDTIAQAWQQFRRAVDACGLYFGVGTPGPDFDPNTQPPAPKGKIIT